MPKRKEPELTPAEQKKRFEALARRLGAQTSADEFKRTLGRIVPKKPTLKKK